MRKVFQYIQEYHMIQENDSMIVGVSGGADSVCLLFALLEFQKRLRFDLAVVHVEHGIRGKESLEDAGFVENLCREQRIPFYLYPVDVAARAREQKLSVEEAGRNARYEAFEDARILAGADKIAVAHNKNDQAETILWNLVRGSGLKGLCGMPSVRGRIIRPLLGVSRKEIEQYLDEKNLAYRTDATNLSDGYTRNKLRLHVLPYMERELNTGAVSHIADAGRRLGQAEEFMEETARLWSGRCIRFGDKEALILPGEFEKCPEVVRGYMLRDCLERIGCGLRDIGGVHVKALMELSGRQPGRRAELPGNCTAVRTQAGIRIFLGGKDCGPEPDSLDELPVQIPGDCKIAGMRVVFSLEEYKNQIIQEKTYTKWLDYDKIYNTVSLRTRRSGDYFITNAAGGRKKLKAYYIDQKIPQEERGRILLVADGSHIMWIVGHRISEAYKVTKDTKRLLKIQVIQEER